MSVNEKMTAIADSIRACTGHTQLLGLTEMAEGVRDSYLSGAYDAGYRVGHEAGFTAGKQAELDTIWDSLQGGGTRVSYAKAFFSNRDLDVWFYPKYDFNMDTASEMFRGATCSADFDLAQRLADCGVSMDFGKCPSLQMTFAYFPVKRLPLIDVSGITADYGIAQTFVGCSNLEELTLGGTLSVNNLNLSSCTKLSRASIESVINVLSTTTSGLSITLSRKAVDNAFGDGTESSGTDSPEFNELIGTKDNWTINLV